MKQRSFSRTLLRPALALSCFAAVLLWCSPTDNPYADYSNARATVVARTFPLASQPGSVTVFTTETLSVVVALREKVDSFSVITPHNRYGDTTTVANTPENPIEARLYHVPFSLTDTGIITLSVVTYRDNGDASSETVSLHCKSPLNQERISARLGRSVALTTPRVGDEDVWYNWMFDTTTTIVSAVSSVDTAIGTVTEPSGTGYLWVSDVKNRCSCPAAPFRFSFRDIDPPEILASYGNSDTVRTGDTTFFFEIQIRDRGFGLGSAPTVNTSSFDQRRGIDTYIKIFEELGHAAATSPLSVVVKAVDKADNRASRTFHLLYDESLAPTGKLQLRMLSPSSNPDTTSSSTLNLLGILSEYTGDTISAGLSLTVNDSTYEPQSLFATAQRLIWTADAGLGENTNTLKIAVQDNRSTAAIETTFTVRYDPERVDETAPVIVEITADGEPADNYHSAEDSVTVRVIAFDEGEGIDSLTINGDYPTRGSNEERFTWRREVGLEHGPDGNPVRIRAVDKNRNDITTTVTIFSNRPPVMPGGLSLSSPISAGDTLDAVLEIFDADDDAVSVLAEEGPEGLTVLGRRLRWVPKQSDVGRHYVRVSLDDGYERTAYTDSVTVISAVNTPCSLTVESSLGAIAGDTLTLADSTGADTLRFRVVDDPVTTGYVVRVLHGITTVVKHLDSARTFDVIIDPSAFPGTRDSLLVILRERDGPHADTVALTLLLNAPQAHDEYARSLRFDTSPTGVHLSTDLYSFPLLVELDDSTFDFDQTSTPGGLVFSKPDGTALPYEVERWDPPNKNATLWVLLDTVHADSSDQRITLKWDTLLTRNESRPRSVFDTSNGFRMVYHLDSTVDIAGAGLSYTNAAQDSYHGVDSTDGSREKGIAGNAAWFDGVDDYIDLGTPDIHSSSLTAAAWVKVHEETGTDMRIFCKSISGSVSSQYWMGDIDGGKVRFRLKTNMETTELGAPEAAVGTGRWTLLFFRYDGDSMYVFRYYGNADDGLMTSWPKSGPVSTEPSVPLWLGGNAASATKFPFWGLIDEFRVSATARSEDWMKLCYESQKPGAQFVEFE